MVQVRDFASLLVVLAILQVAVSARTTQQVLETQTEDVHHGSKPGGGVVSSLIKGLTSTLFTGKSEQQTGPRLTEWPLNLPVEGDGESGVKSRPDLQQYAGYYRLNRTHDARMFYFYFPSRGNPEKDPLILWMTGGPGCSSELAVFFENGPFTITNNLTLLWNDFGWDQAANMIYVDQPVGTGFSYSRDPRDIVHTEDGVAGDVWMFLQEFLEAHPSLKDRDFFVTGESYGGHYVPAVTGRIHKSNKAGEGNKIKLKGMAIGNGLTNPAVQIPAYADFAYQNGLIDESGYWEAQKHVPLCELALRACGSKGVLSCLMANFFCNRVAGTVFDKANRNFNVYDIRLNCTFQPLCYDFSLLDKFLEQPEIRSALGVGDREFQECSPKVYLEMSVDMMRNLAVGIPELLEDGVEVLLYAGEADFICNWIGNSRWAALMEWSGRDAYNADPWVPFVVHGREAGSTTGQGPLKFLKVKSAGHMVPMDQPLSSLEMLRRWIHKKPLAGDGKDEAYVASM